MWLTRFSIRRPIIVSMFFIALALFGLVSYKRLGASNQPNVNFPIVIVFANYPGASPSEMEKLVIKPIEDQIDGIQNLDQLSATAQEGIASVVVQFKLETNLDYAAIDVQRRVDTARVYMPSDLNPPEVIKNGADSPILIYALNSSSMSGAALSDLVNDRVIPEIKHIPNVSGVDLRGDATREIQVYPDPVRLMAVGATLPDIFNALSANNANLPGGRIDAPTVETSVSVHADLVNPADILGIPLPVPGGANKTLRIGDVASVVDGHQEQRRVSHFNGKPGLIMDVNRTVTSDEIKTTNVARERMKEIVAKYPMINFKEVEAPADYTQAALTGVLQSLFEGIVLTAIVLMLFLHAWRNALVVMISIPASLFATFIVMRVLNFTLDNMSLMGLSLIIGILVDDSIVVLENITRHRDLGQAPDDAAISGRTEIGGAAIAITLVDVVVFLPMAFLSGFVGKYMQEFGIVVVVATLFSLFVSFTLTPMLAAKWSVKRRSTAPPRALAWFQVAFDRLTRWYRDVALPLALRHRAFTFWMSMLLVLNSIALVAGQRALVAFAIADGAIAVLAFVWLGARSALRRSNLPAAHLRATISTAALCAAYAVGLLAVNFTETQIKSEFVPSVQTGSIGLTITYPTGTPLATTQAAIDRIESAALRLPNVDAVSSTSGVKPSGWGSTTGGFVGRMTVTMNKSHRGEQDATVGRLRRIVGGLAPGAVVNVSARGGGGSGAPISYTLNGPEDAIDAAANKLAAFIRALPGTVNVQTGAENEAPRLNIRIDPVKCAIVGVSPGAAATAARTAVGGVVATRVRTATGLVDVRLEYPSNVRNSVDQIQRILVRAQDGTMVPLASVADFTYTKAPTKIERVSRRRVVRINGDIDHSKNATLGDISGKVDAALKQPGFLPPGVHLDAQGDTQFFQETLTSMFLALITSFALVYMLMVVLYGSFVTPFVIMFSIPVAIVGALAALVLARQTINIFSLIGLIMLFGLVAKNGILLVDYTNTLRQRGMRLLEALTTAAGTRLRPILMTTCAMVFGMLPLALGLAEGAEYRKSMGVVLIGGLLSSLILTLFVVPSVFMTVRGWIERYEQWRANRRAISAERDDGVAPPIRARAAIGD